MRGAVTAAQADFNTHEVETPSREGAPAGKAHSPGEEGGWRARTRSPSAQAFPAGPALRPRGAAGEHQRPAPEPRDAQVAPDTPPQLACLGRGGAPAPGAQRRGSRGLPRPLRPPPGSTAARPTPEGRGSALGQPRRGASSSRRAEEAALGSLRAAALTLSLVQGVHGGRAEAASAGRAPRRPAAARRPARPALPAGPGPAPATTPRPTGRPPTRRAPLSKRDPHWLRRGKGRGSSHMRAVTAACGAAGWLWVPGGGWGGKVRWEIFGAGWALPTAGSLRT